MKLNTIEFSLSLDDNSDYVVPFVFNFTIDHSLTNQSFWGDNDYHVNPNIILPSYMSGVSGFLFTCGCGTPGCAGIYNECSIIHQQEHIVWIIPQKVSTYDQQGICSYDYFFFEKTEYQRKIYDFCSSINKLGISNHVFTYHNKHHTYSIPSLKNYIEIILHKHEFEIYLKKKRLEKRLKKYK